MIEKKTLSFGYSCVQWISEPFRGEANLIVRWFHSLFPVMIIIIFIFFEEDAD